MMAEESLNLSCFAAGGTTAVILAVRKKILVDNE